MKKTLIIAGLMALFGTLSVGGRGNMVTHLDRDGNPDTFLASRGNCRHHLSSHPGDSVTVAGLGEVADPDACN